MKSKDREQLLDKLLDLMSLHRHSSYDTQGFPYVDEDGTFGLRAGTKSEGLYAAYFLMDKLKAGGLLSGGKPGTDLDTAVYTLGKDKVFEVYDGARVFRDEDMEVTVKITTGKPLADILSAIDKGIAVAHEDYRARAKIEMKGKDERRADRQRDKMASVVSEGADIQLVGSYIAMRVNELFPNSGLTVELKNLPADLQKDLNDYRPRLRASFNHPAGENYLRLNEFTQSLQKVFNGFCAVMAHGGNGDPRDDIDIAGPIPRLAADILEHDSAGARRVLQILAGLLDGQQVAAYSAHIERFDATRAEVTGIKEGISQPLKVGATIKIKAQP